MTYDYTDPDNMRDAEIDRQIEEDGPLIYGPAATRITVGIGGKTYGSWPVLMTKGITVKIGTRMGRYGGVMAEHDGHPFTEQPDEWWEAKGWTITDPPIPKFYRPEEES